MFHRGLKFTEEQFQAVWDAAWSMAVNIQENQTDAETWEELVDPSDWADHVVKELKRLTAERGRMYLQNRKMTTCMHT